jgi:uncharacterized protein (DUF849 family)
VIPGATWTAAGIGREQARVMGWALARGADAVRTGLEDNVYYRTGELAKSNAQLVSRVADLCAQYGRSVATAKQAREILGLRPAG